MFGLKSILCRTSFCEMTRGTLLVKICLGSCPSTLGAIWSMLTTPRLMLRHHSGSFWLTRIVLTCPFAENTTSTGCCWSCAMAWGTASIGISRSLVDTSSCTIFTFSSYKFKEEKEVNMTLRDILSFQWRWCCMTCCYVTMKWSIALLHFKLTNIKEEMNMTLRDILSCQWIWHWVTSCYVTMPWSIALLHSGKQ